MCHPKLMIQDVIPYVVSDFLSWLLPSVLSPLCYVLLVYFIAGLRDDNLAANLFTMIASVRLSWSRVDVEVRG